MPTPRRPKEETHRLMLPSPRIAPRAQADGRALWLATVLLDTLEDVRVSFLLPLRQVVPVCHVGWLWFWEMLKDLPDPTESNKASFLRTGELRSTAVGGVYEREHLIVNGSSAVPFPLGGFVPRCNVAGFWLSWVMPRDPGDPCLTEDASLFYQCIASPPKLFGIRP